MKTSTTRTILHAFLEKCPTEEQQKLLGYLNLPQRQAVVTTPKTYGNPLKVHEDPSKLLDWIHGSWISPFLRTLSEKEIGLFLSCLSHEKASAVGKEILYKESPLPVNKIQQNIPLSSSGKSFLQATLIQYLTAEVDDLLPIECLPESPLNLFLSLSPEATREFVSLFGLHDLAVEVKQIIDRQKLSKIYESLTKNQHSYLKLLLQSHEPVVFASMGLSHWSGDQERLQLLIEQRGINRLAKVLHSQDRTLFWYILHRLDMQQALLLRTLSKPLDSPRSLQLLTQEGVDLIHYLGKGTHG